MFKLNLCGAYRAPLFSAARTTAYALLIFPLFFNPLYGQAGGGNDGAGPGPNHQNQARNYVHGSEWENVYGVENLAYYGDWDSNRVFVIDIDEMSLLKTVEDTGDGPYGCDQQDQETAYALTRKTKSLTVIENYNIENIGKIFLDHKPRSTHFNAATGLSLVSGADKVMTSIIDVGNDEVIKVIGFDEPAVPGDYGGSLATGHPAWVGNEHFFMLDRPGRQIQFWSIDGELLSVLDTPTSVHHVFQAPSKKMATWYAVAEGNQYLGLSPSILKFRLYQKRLEMVGEAVLSDIAPGILDPFIMGSHHAAFHPDGVHVYVGSAEGHVFVVNTNTMQVVHMLEAGLGAGHTTFVPDKGLAFVTNHNDTFMTVIDTTTHSWLKNIEVADSSSPDFKSQAHTSGVSPDSMHFYSAASHDGVFFEIDTDLLEISDDLDVGFVIGESVNILMGSIVWGGESGGGM